MVHTIRKGPESLAPPEDATGPLAASAVPAE